MITSKHAQEIRAGRRFAFGENWASFLRTLDDARVVEAERSLIEMLQAETLVGKRFIDVGSGSGLFSLAARRLGATVRSFDFDPQSVACTAELRRRFFRDDPEWIIEEGSVLDAEYVSNLGRYDVVYSWGVLHHTGQMWKALENVSHLVGPGGLCEVALYNTSAYSRRWNFIKRTYCGLPRLLKPVFAGMVIAPLQVSKFSNALIRFRPYEYAEEIRHYYKSRGMSWWHDQIDWLGGYPYETAKPEEVFAFFSDRKFTLEKLRTCGGGTGCNDFVFRKAAGGV